MGPTLAVGDRIRVTANSRVAGYLPGEKGTIVWVSLRRGPPDQVAFYHVQMDSTGPSRHVAFFPDEVELDV
jgi:hypothetical protein